MESFRPERWLDADEPTWRAMDRADLGFSYGRRVCIGRHLALIEIKKVVTSLIVAFKVSFSFQYSFSPCLSIYDDHGRLMRVVLTLLGTRANIHASNK